MKWIKFDDPFIQEETFEAGTLLKLENGEVIMIGDLNTNLGICDCCRQPKVAYFCNDFIGEIKALKEKGKVL